MSAADLVADSPAVVGGQRPGVDDRQGRVDEARSKLRGVDVGRTWVSAVSLVVMSVASFV